MKYVKPEIKETEIVLEDIIALSNGDGTNPDSDSFFNGIAGK